MPLYVATHSYSYSPGISSSASSISQLNSIAERLPAATQIWLVISYSSFSKVEASSPGWSSSSGSSHSSGCSNGESDGVVGVAVVGVVVFRTLVAGVGADDVGSARGSSISAHADNAKVAANATHTATVRNTSMVSPSTVFGREPLASSSGGCASSRWFSIVRPAVG